MALLEDGLSFFGLQIVPKKSNENLSAALSTDENDDGAAIVAAANNAAYNGIFFDVDGSMKDEQQAIQKYRDIALFPEIDIALDDIVNEAMPQEDDDDQIKLNLDALEYSDNLKEKMHEEFETILTLLNYRNQSAEIFRKWYIDGRLFYQIIVDKENPQKGIAKLLPIDALKVKKVREINKKTTTQGVQVIDKVTEYYVYSDMGFGAKANSNKAVSSNAQGLKLSKDSIIYVPSGFMDSNSGLMLGYLHKAVRPCNQLRMLEDATVVYFIARAPERRVFYVDVGNLPKLKAEQYMKDIMNRFRNKMVYDAKTGDVRDDKKYMSMLEDFWMPRRDGGKGTEITTLPGAANITGYLDSLEWFKNKLYESLNIPTSRLQAEGGFNLGRSSEISRDELKFQKFIEKLRNKFAQLLQEALKTQFILKGICNDAQWEQEIKHKIKFEFQRDNFYAEFKNQELMTSRLEMLQTVDPYLLKYFSKEWVWKNILKFSQEEIDIMQEQMENEISDASAAPAYTNPVTGQTTDPTMMGGSGQSALTAISPAAQSKSGQSNDADGNGQPDATQNQ